ncbi:MAG: hypothetical protein LH478_08405 [Chitinophagaceae bacterium]|nr:hypothetical protein [Chitinophagaceae bacterium]
MIKWYRVALFNLVLLAFLGLVLRYKIIFSLGFIEQKNLLHAHSHFAFTGWISFLLQALILQHFTTGYKIDTKFWDRFFVASSIVNYGMIVSFAWVGYAGISIVLSTAALWLSYIFAYKIYKILPPSKKENLSIAFIKASLLFLVLSSAGPYAVSILIALKSTHQYWYHNALYFFLHFQYNGWFTFAVLAFLFQKIESTQVKHYKQGKLFFWLLAITCIPSFLFTTLWHRRPVEISAIIIVSAVVQSASLFFLIKILHSCQASIFTLLPKIIRWLYTLALSAFILKVVLQLFSIHSGIAQLAFGFRPIIIGYLHLIFLVFVSLYLLGLLAEKNIIPVGVTMSKWALIIFSGAVIINEVLLGVQGFASITYHYFASLNLILFVNTIALFTGAVLIYTSSLKNIDHASTKNMHENY